MDHDSALLIYLQTTTPATRIPSTQVINYDRGTISTPFKRLCLEMRDEQKRLSSFDDLHIWKHSYQISQMLSKAGYFSVSDSSPCTKVACSFCSAKYTFQLTTSNYDEQLTAFIILQQRHSVSSATCPRCLGLNGDNLPFQNIHLHLDSIPEQSSTCHSILESDICSDWKEEADSEYCNEESEIRIAQVSNDGELAPIPYTMDLFSELLPVSGARKQFEHKTSCLDLDNIVDPKEVKARLELDTVRYILASSEDTISHMRESDNYCFLSDMSQENREKSLRVAVESAIFWQLKCTTEQYFSVQDLFGHVWRFLTQMSNLNIQNPIEFADLYNQNVESELQRNRPLTRLPHSQQYTTQIPIFNHPITQNQNTPQLPIFNHSIPTIPPTTLNLYRTASSPSTTTSITQSSITTSAQSRVGVGGNTVHSIQERTIVCKVCLDEPAEYVLIPCGHFVACGTCTRQLTDCPICRHYIRGTIKPFFP